jgi:hypothetical protein
MKQNLTVEQSARLIELGVDKKRASKCSSYMKTSASCRGIIQVPQYNPIFTLSDVLEMLPKEMEVDFQGNVIALHLVIVASENSWEVSYSDNNTLQTAPELIDALFNLLVWVLTNYKDQVNK